MTSQRIKKDHLDNAPKKFLHQPGNPGGAWTSEEFDIVRRKVFSFFFRRKAIALINYRNESPLKGVGIAQPKELQLETPEGSFHTGGDILRMAGAE